MEFSLPKMIDEALEEVKMAEKRARVMDIGKVQIESNNNKDYINLPKFLNEFAKLIFPLLKVYFLKET